MGMVGALDVIRRYLGTLEAALADPGWNGQLPGGVDLEAATALQEAELAEARELLERMGALRDALTHRMADTLAETGEIAPRRSAARSYLQHAPQNFAP